MTKRRKGYHDRQIRRFKKVDRRKLNDITKEVNCVLKYVTSDSISDTNKLIKAAAVYIGEQMGLKQKLVGKSLNHGGKEKQSGDIKGLKKDVNILERYTINELNNTNKYNRLDRKHHSKRERGKNGNQIIQTASYG